jgi:type II secretory pathway pseudopilin PulG
MNAMIFRRISVFIFTDLLVTVLVIAAAAAVLLSAIRHTLNVVRVTASAAEVMGYYRADLSAYYALQGEWPKDREELRALFPHQPAIFNADADKNVRITGGAIDIRLQRQLAGKILTLHPAVPIDDPLGPVKWVAGSGSGSDGWSIIGDDHTTVQREYIMNILQR